MKIVAKTDQGKVRKDNQDSFAKLYKKFINTSNFLGLFMKNSLFSI